jgi:YfiH family protein
MHKSESLQFIQPHWPAPAHVKAFTTTRDLNNKNGSRAPYAALNLAEHVGDDPQQVHANRESLRQQLQLPNEPCWLQQVHGDTLLNAGVCTPGQQADAIYAEQPGQVCVVMTADCLPLLLCDRAGTVVAAVHAGWRGLQSEIIIKTVAALPVATQDVLVWLGPAISAQSYEVDATVYDQFKHGEFKHGGVDYSSAFQASRPGHWRMDLYRIARLQLNSCGVTSISGGDYCTYQQSDLFYSHRRDGVTGRMASLIWL